MDNKILAKQIIDYHKSAFDSTFKSVTILQEQTDKIVHGFIQQAAWLPAEAKSAVNEWLNIYKKGRIDLKDAADVNYKKVEEYFTSGMEIPKVKERKPKSRV